MKVTPFAMADTHGYPLAATMDWCKKHGMAVDTCAFIREALAAGWGNDKIRAALVEAVSLTRGRDEGREFNRALNMILGD